MGSVALGGAIGSVARFACGFCFSSWLGTAFPWGTLFVNVAGSLWIGWIATLVFLKPGSLDPVLRLFLTTGFAGGFTTFSTFAYETLEMYQRGSISLVGANIAANVCLALSAVWIGSLLARSQSGF